MNTPSSNVVSPSLAASSPHLLKELTSGTTSTTSSIKASSDNSRMTVSNNTEATPAASATAEVSAQPSGHPPCKKLKLDIEVANNIGSSKTTTMRQRLLEKRLARRARQIESYKDNMSELFFLQSKGNVVDLPTFRKRPSQQYLNFLKSNNAPDDIMDEVRLAVLGPNAVFEKVFFGPYFHQIFVISCKYIFFRYLFYLYLFIYLFFTIYRHQFRFLQPLER